MMHHFAANQPAKTNNDSDKAEGEAWALES